MIRTTHKEFDIFYDEDDNTWRCSELSMHAVSLGALKGKINDRLAAERRIEPPVPVFVMEYNAVLTGEAVLLEADKGDGVWVTLSNKKRAKYAAERLVPLTPENGRLIDKARALDKESERLMREARNIRQNLKRYTVGELRQVGLKTKPE